jgi:hypothetical protein
VAEKSVRFHGLESTGRCDETRGGRRTKQTSS